MPLIPRWRYMSDEAKALTKRTAVSALVALFFLLVLRALIPWVLLALVAWWIWAAVKKEYLVFVSRRRSGLTHRCR